MTSGAQAVAPVHPSISVVGQPVFVKTVMSILFGFGKTKPANPGQPQWGIMPASHDTAEYCKNLLDLLNAGCRGVVVVALEGVHQPEDIAEHRFLSPYLTKHFRFARGLSQLCNAISGQPERTMPGQVRRYVEAILVHQSLKSFSHGSDGDVVNRFLAPVRLATPKCREMMKPENKENWGKFCGAIRTHEKCSALADEIVDACLPISDWLKQKSPAEIQDDKLERVMLLMTQVRTMADVRSKDRVGSPLPTPVKPLGTNVAMQNRTAGQTLALGRSESIEERNDYRILVVDDHAATWRSVFADALGELEGRLGQKNIKIEFSLNGKHPADSLHPDEGGRSFINYSAYDLILLDLHLGWRSGIDILEEIRRDNPLLPVLLWTTSRDEEATAPARMANGILLKKTITRSEWLDSLVTWTRRGKCFRTGTLPNPFFNHAIQSPELRQLAMDFHEWCLKQLDSFHALDGEFFRYFTDHGGRHIVKLLELWQSALEPFLHSDENLLPPHVKDKCQPSLTGTSPSFPPREIELLRIYLAVLCHELGMFPMRVGEQVENFEKLPGEYLQDVRTLHAARGMALVAESSGRYWNDAEGKKLGERIRHLGMEHGLAAVVGYHGRLFGSMSTECFLNWNGKCTSGTGKDESPSSLLQKKLDRLKSSSVTLTLIGNEFKDNFEAISGKYAGLNNSMRERLRRQCALFRFVDALDVSRSRNPAEYLSMNARLPPTQLRENFKRDICTSVAIDNGSVKVSVCVAPPVTRTVQKVLEFVEKNKIGGEKELKSATDSKKLMKDPAWDRYSTCPWMPPEEKSNWTLIDICTKSAHVMQAALDEWLTRVWAVVGGTSRDSLFIQHLKNIKVLDKNMYDPVLTLDGANIVAGITALAVAGELLDEYQAVVEVNLQHIIKLSHGNWVWGNRLTEGEQLCNLPTLRVGLDLKFFKKPKATA